MQEGKLLTLEALRTLHYGSNVEIYHFMNYFYQQQKTNITKDIVKYIQDVKFIKKAQKFLAHKKYPSHILKIILITASAFSVICLSLLYLPSVVAIAVAGFFNTVIIPLALLLGRTDKSSLEKTYQSNHSKFEAIIICSAYFLHREKFEFQNVRALSNSLLEHTNPVNLDLFNRCIANIPRIPNLSSCDIKSLVHTIKLKVDQKICASSMPKI